MQVKIDGIRIGVAELKSAGFCLGVFCKRGEMGENGSEGNGCTPEHLMGVSALVNRMTSGRSGGCASSGESGRTTSQEEGGSL